MLLAHISDVMLRCMMSWSCCIAVQELVDNLEDDEYYQDEYFDQDFECE